MNSNNDQLIWLWNRKPVALDTLDERVLHSIKNSIDKSPNKVWFGTDSKVWVKSIKHIINERNYMYLKLKRMRHQKAAKKADDIINILCNSK